MRIMLLGAPGAGKGTQSSYITQALYIPQISTGEMLRASVKSGSALGLQAKQIMDAGKLISDDIIIPLVVERLKAPDCKTGFLFDGFTRTMGQACALAEHHIQLDYVIEIALNDEVIVERMSGRRVHPASGRIYHTVYNPPRVDGKDDLTGEPLVLRSDDSEETVRNRLAVYHEQTIPLIDYYQHAAQIAEPLAVKYIRVDGFGSVDSIKARIFAALGLMEVMA